MGLLFPAALLAACGGRLSAPEGELRRYALSLQVETEAEAPGAPEALRQELDRLGDTAEALELRLSMQRVIQHRDGSEGVLVRFEAAEVEAASGALALPLQGRTALLRRFGDGEILQLDGAAHLVGTHRQGEILDLLWPLLSPHPPDLSPGEEARRTARWPLRVADEQGQRGLLEATWRYLGSERVDGERIHHVAYSGRWETLGSDRLAPTPRGVRGEGEAAGEVWLTDSLELVAHDFDWWREAVLRGPALEGGERRELRQRQAFTGRLERLP